MLIVMMAVMPIFILLLLGYIANGSGFISLSTWAQIEKATYFVLFPCLLVQQLANAAIDWASALLLILAALFIPVVASILAFGWQRLVAVSGASFTSVYQGSIRFNTYIGLALTLAVLPKAALPLAAIVMAMMIPWINILCLIVFARYAHGQMQAKTLFKQMARNPLIVGSVVGIFLNISGWGLPAVLNEVLKHLGSMTLPLGLLSVGAGLKWRSVAAHSVNVMGASVIKLVLLPLLMAGVVMLLGLDALSGAVVVVFASLPTASSAYILARQLGGDADLMAAVITVQTLVSILTLPMVLWAVNYWIIP